MLVSLMNFSLSLTGHRLWVVHVRRVQSHGGIQLERDVDCQRYFYQNTLSLFTHFICRLSESPICWRNARESAPVSAKPMIQVTVAVLCRRGRSLVRIQSVWVHPASGTAAETRGYRGDQKHRHPDVAVQSSWRRRCCHLLRHRGL